MNYTGKTALITGASSGIGKAFAEALAQRGMALTLVARSSDKLQALAADLHQQHGVQVETIVADLSQENMGWRVYEETQRRGLAVEILINNAGFSSQGQFETLSPQIEHQEVMLNVVSVVDLTHAFVPAMLDRGSGVIINVGSTASFFPLPYQAVYAATKAFVLSFTEALWAEYQQRGIRVLALCPGATDTQFFNAMGRETSLSKQSPQEVVRVCLAALEHDRPYVIPGWQNNVQAQVLPRLLPHAAVARLAGRVVRRVMKVATPGA